MACGKHDLSQWTYNPVSKYHGVQGNIFASIYQVLVTKQSNIFKLIRINW